MEPTLPHAPFAFLPRDSRRWQERDTPVCDAIFWFYEEKIDLLSAKPTNYESKLYPQ